MRDVQELATASEQLAAAAGVIRRVNPSWGEGVVNLLIAANQVVVRIQEKGAGAYARYLQRHGTETGPERADIVAAGEMAPEPPTTPQNEEEG